MALSTEKTKRKVVRKVPGVCVLFSDGTIRLDNVRASHPYVGKAQTNEDDEGNVTESFSCGAYMPKETHKQAMLMCKGRIEEILKVLKVKALPPERKFIRDGDTLGKEEAEGMWVISSRDRNPPQLRGSKLDPETGKPQRLTPQEAMRMFYGGCYINLLIRPWPQDHKKFGKRVNAGLVAVQFKKDGKPFGEGRISEDEIDNSFDGDEPDDDWGAGDDDDL